MNHQVDQSFHSMLQSLLLNLVSVAKSKGSEANIAKCTVPSIGCIEGILF